MFKSFIRLKWTATWYWAPCVFASGILVGLLLCAPVVGWSLPESTANIMGAAVGAAAAVFGAFWLSQAEAGRQARVSAEALLGSIFKLHQECLSFCEMEDYVLDELDGTGGIRRFREKCERTTERIRRLGGSGAALGREAVQAISRVEDEADSLAAFVRGAYEANGPYTGEWNHLRIRVKILKDAFDEMLSVPALKSFVPQRTSMSEGKE